MSNDIPAPQLQEVSDGIFAYLQLHGQWGLNNAGFFVGADSVTLIDTCFTVSRSQALAAAVRDTAGDRPVRTLVNTHHHGDHTHGNSVFGPGVTIVGHELCREEVIATGVGTKAIWPYVDWGDIVVTPPNVTFADRLAIYAGDLRVELIFAGPAHTTNDIIAWVPERRLLFAGDTVFSGGTPFALFGSVAGSLDTIATVRALGAETIVPGHGPVCDSAVLDGIEAYFRFVQDTARAGFEANTPPLDLARATDLGRFAALHDSERLVANLHRAYSELRGEAKGIALPIMPIWADMIAFNGGEMPRCLA